MTGPDRLSGWLALLTEVPRFPWREEELVESRYPGYVRQRVTLERGWMHDAGVPTEAWVSQTDVRFPPIPTSPERLLRRLFGRPRKIYSATVVATALLTDGGAVRAVSVVPAGGVVISETQTPPILPAGVFRLQVASTVPSDLDGLVRR